MDAPRCFLCDAPGTMRQGDCFVCPDHATDKAALRARLHALESATLPADPATRDRVQAEIDAIEDRIGELEAGA